MKLEMTASKTDGQFVKTLKGQTGTGFSEGTHVHKDWYAQTISYDDALEQAEDAIREREDILVPTKDIFAQVTDDGEFAFRVNHRSFIPTDHAIEQFSTRVGVPSSSVLRELRKQSDFDRQDAGVMVDLANNALRRIDDDKVYRLRTYTDGTCRAFVTDRYAPVDNRWYLETLQEFLPDGRLSHWRGDEDTIYGNILLPDTMIDYDDDSDYGGMVTVGNCEIGKRTITQRPSLFRSICMNGCIWGQVEGTRIKRRHIGNIDLESLKVEIGENIEHQLPLLPNAITEFLNMRKLSTATSLLKNVIGTICKENKFSKVESCTVLDQYNRFESHDRNLFGVVNAITRAGQLFDNKTWVRFDEVGGSLVGMGGRWNTLLQRSNLLQDSDLEKIYGVMV